MNRIRLPVVLVLTTFSLVLIPRPVSGADGDTAFLFSFDSTQFPQISAYLSASDSFGGRMTGLTSQDLSLKEDDVPAQTVVLTEEQTGVRVIVVIDPGLDMLYALPDGETRFERIHRALTDWLGGLGQSGIDDLTLVTPDGITVSHTSDREQFLGELKAYSPKVPSERALDALLVEALGAAAEPFPRRGMRAFVIVFSASKLSQSEGIGQGVCPRALELHAVLYGIWSGRVEPSVKKDMESLESLANACSGYSAALESSTGTATLLSIISTQRTQYRLEYRSAASLSGEHTLTAAVAREAYQAETDPLRFTLDIQPPALQWIDFPDRLTRKGSEVSQPVDTYLPDAIDLAVDVTFPDGHPRTIVSMQLFADNELVSECTAFPCTGVRWDLRESTESGEITLQMVVRDELGLEGRTAERQLALQVERPTIWEIFRADYLLPVTILLAILAVVGFLIAAIVNLNRVIAIQEASELLFPHPQTVILSKVAGWKERWAGKSRNPRTPPAAPEETFAVLEGLGETKGTFEITAADTILGTDPGPVGIIISDPSVSARHARIVRMGDGIPWVFDLGSTAGTWINYDQIPPDGVSLREGDRLNLGRTAFRVRLTPCLPAKEIIHEA